MSGILYIVPTPVGNMGDMTSRAVEVLKSVNHILAEDTRTSTPLLKHFDITTPLSSYHKFNEHTSTRPLVARIEAGENIALISDAGTPGISDPGFMLARECRRAGIDVVTLPGPTAFVPALVNSGLPCDRFIFQGFLPQKKGRRTRLEEIADSPVTSVIYESPLRVLKTLEALGEVCGVEREVSVSREISKKFEQTVRGSIDEVVRYFAENQPRGEFVIVVAPKPEDEKGPHKNKYRD